MPLSHSHWFLTALVLGAIGILVGLIYLAGASPGEAFGTLWKGSLGSPRSISGTLREVTPLLITGLSVFVGLRAGLFNIGAEGQLVVGACACAVVALKFPGPNGIILGVLASMIAGSLWAFPAGLIKAYRNGHEVITTIMLNNVALLFTDWLVSGPIRAAGQESTTTSRISDSTQLPFLIHNPSFEVGLGLGVAVVATILTAIWMKRTVAGYELQAVGANPTASRFAGIIPERVTLAAMIGSGAIAGFGGAIQVLGSEGRFYMGFSPGYGFDGLGIALLAGSNAYALLPASFLFGVLAKGGVSLGIMGIPKGITRVVVGLIILVAAAVRFRKGTRVA